MINIVLASRCVFSSLYTFYQTGCAEMSAGLAVLCLLLLQTGALGFQVIFGGGSLKHQDITERAILNVTVQACRALALAEGRDFTFPVRIRFFLCDQCLHLTLNLTLQ